MTHYTVHNIQILVVLLHKWGNVLKGVEMNVIAQLPSVTDFLCMLSNLLFNIEILWQPTYALYHPQHGKKWSFTSIVMAVSI